jgi:ATP-dependent Clp protease ATP-binding subunit ClpC
MSKRLTDRARRVVVYAQEEARALSHEYVGSEHLLLGLIREEDGIGARALASLGLSLAGARARVVEMTPANASRKTGHIPWTREAKSAIEGSLRESLELGHRYVGTEHVLLGLTRQDQATAATLLVRLETDAQHVRRRVLQILDGAAYRATSPTERSESAQPMRAGSRPGGELDDRLAEVKALKAWAVDHRRFEIAALLSEIERLLLELRHPEEHDPDQA